MNNHVHKYFEKRKTMTENSVGKTNTMPSTCILFDYIRKYMMNIFCTELNRTKLCGKMKRNQASPRISGADKHSPIIRRTMNNNNNNKKNVYL